LVFDDAPLTSVSPWSADQLRTSSFQPRGELRRESDGQVSHRESIWRHNFSYPRVGKCGASTGSVEMQRLQAGYARCSSMRH